VLNGNIKEFEDLAILKMTREIVIDIYTILTMCKDYGFRDQISRAGISIMNNISEGFGRTADADFRKFPGISKGSASEARSMFYIAEDLGYMSKESAFEMREKLQKLINSIGTFMKYLKSS